MHDEAECGEGKQSFKVLVSFPGYKDALIIAQMN